jgi:predicted nucleotidyltransferase
VGAASSRASADLDARLTAEELGRLAGVRSVCVIGSSARGDFTDSSDIDLLALVDDGEVAAAARALVGAERSGRPVQLKLLSETRLAKLFELRSTFAVHVLREAVVVVDPHGRFAALCQQHSRDEPVCDNRKHLLIRLELYEDLEWCQGMYLYCLADLYSIGRAAAYTILGRGGRFEFSGVRALGSLSRYQPGLASAAESVGALRPFFLLADRDKREELPFPYRDCHRDAMSARDACYELVNAIE